VGGIGSGALAKKEATWLSHYECAVAFDRPRTHEIITHQRGGRCCSDKFADALAKRLNEKGMAYTRSSNGIFTDTANYRSIIPECTNIGVGYEGHHTRSEQLDYAHANALLDAVCKIDWDALPIDRDPKAVETYNYNGGYRGGQYGGYNGHGRSYPNGFTGDDWDDLGDYPLFGRSAAPSSNVHDLPTQGKKKGKKQKNGSPQQQHPKHQAQEPQLTMLQELSQCSMEEILAWCEESPADAAECIGKLLIKIQQQQSTVATMFSLLGWKDEDLQ
jgi:hypothetical protein